MSDGGYSRLEKDFLGNERMVHYDGSGNMIGASDVVREPDGTIRIPNEPGSATASTVSAPAADLNAHLPKDAGVRMRQKQALLTSKVITYIFAALIDSMLLTLAVLNFRASGGRPTTVQYVPQTNTTPYSAPPTVRNDTQDDSRPNNALPDDPKPRNDQDSNEAKPYDQTAPDMNSGDDSHPKIDDGGKKPDTKPKSDDPIDLRGDGDGKAGDGGTSKTDPNDIH